MRQRFARAKALVGSAFGAAGRLTVMAVGSVGAREYLLLAGLGLAGYGISLIYWPAAFILPGAVLAAVAVFGVR